jgi:hypothetical protein
MAKESTDAGEAGEKSVPTYYPFARSRAEQPSDSFFLEAATDGSRPQATV